MASPPAAHSAAASTHHSADRFADIVRARVLRRKKQRVKCTLRCPGMSENTDEVFIGGTKVEIVDKTMEGVTVLLPLGVGVSFRNRGDPVDKFRDASSLESAVRVDEVDDGMQEGRELHNTVDRANWCVTLDDLKELRRLVKAAVQKGLIKPVGNNFDPKDMEKGPDIRTVNEQFIKRITKEKGGMSWALMKHPEGRECDLFITHSWEEGIFEFLSKVIASWPRRAKHAYCCMLANPQNLNIAHLLTEPKESPFAKSLLKAEKMMVVPNSSSSIYTRLWCAYEAYIAHNKEKLIFTAREPMFEIVAYRLGVVAAFAACGWARRSFSEHHDHVDHFAWASPFVFLVLTLLSNRTSLEKYVCCCAGAHDAFHVVAACLHQHWCPLWLRERWAELKSVEVLGLIYVLFGIYFFISVTDLVSAKICKTASEELRKGYRGSVRYAECSREEDKIAIYGEMKPPQQEVEPDSAEVAKREPAEDGEDAQKAGGREKAAGGPPAESSGCRKSATTHEVEEEDGEEEEDEEEGGAQVKNKTIVAVDARIQALIDAGLSTKNMWEAQTKKMQLHEVAYVQWGPAIVSLIWTVPFLFNIHASYAIRVTTQFLAGLDLGVAACLALSLGWMDPDRRAIAVACLQKVHMFIPFLAVVPSVVACAVNGITHDNLEKVLPVLFMIAAGMGLLAKLCCACLFCMDLNQIIHHFGPETAQALVTYGFGGVRLAITKIWQSDWLQERLPQLVTMDGGAPRVLRAASSSSFRVPLRQRSGAVVSGARDGQVRPGGGGHSKALQQLGRERDRRRRQQESSRQDEDGVELVPVRSTDHLSGESWVDPGSQWEELIREIKFDHAQHVRVENDELEIEGRKRRFQILLPKPSSGRSRAALLLIHGSSRGGGERHRGLAVHLAARLGVVVLVPDVCCVDDAVVFATWLQWRAEVDACSLVLGGFRDGGVLAFEAAAKLRGAGTQPAAAVLLLDAVPRQRWLAGSLAGELSDAPAPHIFLLRPLFTPCATPQLPQWSGKWRFMMVEVPSARHADVEAAGYVEDSGEAWNDNRPRDGFGRLLLGRRARVEKAFIFQTLIDAFLREVFPRHTAPREGDTAALFSSVREAAGCLGDLTAHEIRGD